MYTRQMTQNTVCDYYEIHNWVSSKYTTPAADQKPNIHQTANSLGLLEWKLQQRLLEYREATVKRKLYVDSWLEKWL